MQSLSFGRLNNLARLTSLISRQSFKKRLEISNKRAANLENGDLKTRCHFCLCLFVVIRRRLADGGRAEAGGYALSLDKATAPADPIGPATQRHRPTMYISIAPPPNTARARVIPRSPIPHVRNAPSTAEVDRATYGTADVSSRLRRRACPPFPALSPIPTYSS